MKMKTKNLRLILVILLCFASVNVLVLNAVAGQFYPSGYNACINVNGGAFLGIYSVTNYACPKAVEKDQNACASWLGFEESTTMEYYIGTATTGTINAKLWGMCTDRENTSSRMNILNSGNPASITCEGNNCNFKRSGIWGQPSQNDKVRIDIAKFINGAAIVTSPTGKKAYYRKVFLSRCHSDFASCGIDFSDIWLTVDGTPPPPPPPADCSEEGWKPSTYTDSNETGGVTSMVIKARNTDPRFNNAGQAEWGTIRYAKPTDKVEWYACYYPGVQKTANTEVSKVNEGKLNDFYQGYDPLNQNTCQAALPVTTKKMYEAWRLSNKKWENRYKLLKTGGGLSDIHENIPPNEQLTFSRPSDDTDDGFGVGVSNPQGTGTEAITQKRDAGKIYTEEGQIGTPWKVSIKDVTLPTKKIYKEGTCCDGENKVKINNDSRPSCVGPPTGNINPDGINGNNPPLNADGSGTACFVNNNPDCSKDKCEDVDGNYRCLQCINTYDPNKTKEATVKEFAEEKFEASVWVPYNYKNYTGVELGDEVAFAGEEVKIDGVWVYASPRYNEETKDDYATIVPKVEVRLLAYVADESHKDSFDPGEPVDSYTGCDKIGFDIAKQCMEFGSDGGVNLVNPDGDLAGGEPKFFFKDAYYNAFDASAGDYMCFVGVVWPATSGDFTNIKTDGDNKWRYSDPSCIPIAKRPSFQVWGGDMYSKVEVNNPFADKRNVYAGYWGGNWKLGGNFNTSGGNVTHFGSWVEEGLMLGGDKVGTSTYGKTDTIASGAALGERDKPEKAKTGNEGGLCDKMAPLTFSNVCTGDGPAQSSGIGSLSGSMGELIDYWVNNTDRSDIRGERSLGDLLERGVKQESATKTTIKYLKVNGGLTITGGVMPKNTTLLIDHDQSYDDNYDNGVVTIDDNIIYQDRSRSDSKFNSLAEIPKLIIYANRIKIKCSVTEIDAILIANSRLNTCYDGEDESDTKRANQLKIVGTVIVGGEKTYKYDGPERTPVEGGITLGRTYGAAAWGGGDKPNGQGKAAEIFDYDSTMLMWSEYMSSSAQTDTLQTVYQQELAPRY